MIRVTFTAPPEEASLRVAVDACVQLCERMESDLSQKAGLSVYGPRKPEGALKELFSGPFHVSVPGVEVEFKHEGFTILVRSYSDGVEIVRDFLEAEEKNKSLGEDEGPCLFIGP